VVLAPVAGVKSAEVKSARPGLTKPFNPLMTVTRRIRSPGRARYKPLKPLRAGMPGDLGWTCGDYARVLCFTICTRGYGCGGHPAFPTPSVFLGEESIHSSGALRRGIADAYPKAVIPCVTASPLSLEVRAQRASKDEQPGPSSFETRRRRRSSSDNGEAVAQG